MRTAQDYKQLFQQYMNDNISPGDYLLLREWITDAANQEHLDECIVTAIRNRDSQPFSAAEMDGDELYKALLQREELATLPHPILHRVHWLTNKWFRSAAIVIICLATAVYLWTTNRHKQDTAITTNHQQLSQDLGPGSEKATLTLADGSKIILDKAVNGNLASQGGVQVVKPGDGQIVYHVKDLPAGKILWNTMSTPPGGQYQLILPDGSKVWLNAASSITYPTAFTGNKREVKVNGEVYFEVAKNGQKPFIVNVNEKSLVEVLGTSFNINAYENEDAIKTTLVEGLVRVNTITLKPGQQAVATADRQTNVLNASIDQVVAWKNGLFNFNGLDLHSIMRQVERWYDVKVQYQRPVDNGVFKGNILRSVNLSDVLEIIQEVGGIQYKLEGKTLIVL